MAGGVTLCKLLESRRCQIERSLPLCERFEGNGSGKEFASSSEAKPKHRVALHETSPSIDTCQHGSVKIHKRTMAFLSCSNRWVGGIQVQIFGEHLLRVPDTIQLRVAAA